MPMFGADGLKLRPGARSILDPGLGSQQSNVGSAFPPPFSANPGWAINERGATAFPGIDLSSLPTADTALPTMPARKPGFFARNGAGVDLLGGAFDGLATALGGQAMYGPARTFARQQERADATLREANARQDAQRLQERQWSVEDRDAKMNAPQYFMAGHDRVRLDPTTGASEVVYDAPEDYEAYASTLGFQPGDNGYQGAVQDYVLRGAGPTAIAGRESLEGVRQGNRMALRQTPTYRETHPAPRRGMAFRGPASPRSPAGVIAPILGRVAAGQPITPAQQAALDYYKRPSGRSAGGGGGGAPRISSQADYAKLAKGAAYIAPDGSRRVKP